MISVTMITEVPMIQSQMTMISGPPSMICSMTLCSSAPCAAAAASSWAKPVAAKERERGDEDEEWEETAECGLNHGWEFGGKVGSGV